MPQTKEPDYEDVDYTVVPQAMSRTIGNNSGVQKKTVQRYPRRPGGGLVVDGQHGRAPTRDALGYHGGHDRDGPAG
jgi:hypothetical protein